MSASPTTPVREIEGIGPAIEARLQSAGVFHIFDLLRVTADRLLPAVQATSSLEQVRAWQAMARFLQIDEMTPQWAEAVSRGGIETLEEFQGASLDRLQTIFQEAEQQSIIAETPTTPQLFDMAKSASAIFNTGSLNGTVVDPSGQPIAGVTVRLGYRTAATDARGRFRIWGIPLGREPQLVLEHANHGIQVEEAPSLSVNPELVDVQVFTMLGSAGTTTPLVLDEYDGHRLPKFSGMPVRSIERDLADLREGDVLIVHRFYSRSPNAMLASRFLAYSNGEFQVSRWAVPLTMLPEGVEAKENLQFRNGSFHKVSMSNARFEVIKAMARGRNVVSRPATRLAPTELMQQIDARKQAFKSEGAI